MMLQKIVFTLVLAASAMPGAPAPSLAPAAAGSQQADGAEDKKKPPVTYQDLNNTLGIPLWNSDDLWNESAATVARRLRWPQESKTTYDSSYRLYPQPEAQVLGAHPHSLALYGDNAGHVSRLSMVFANTGDIQDAVQAYTVKNHLDSASSENKAGNRITDARVQAAIAGNLRDNMDQESRVMKRKLTDLLGLPKWETYGAARNVSEQMMRWDWNGHTILISADNAQCLSVSIVPSTNGEGTQIARMSESKTRTTLAGRVQHRPNGDVIISDIPMVNQGPKGYCVPTTWERNLRYLGIPADMYVLAAAAGSGLGGGTSVRRMTDAVDNLARTYERHIIDGGGRISIPDLSLHIDKGIPVMWAMYVVEDLNTELTARAAERATTTDWTAYKKTLTPKRNNARFIKTDSQNGHMCMIIGYNQKTSEIAISDSWGPKFAERWITVEEAQAISQGDFVTIGW